MVAFHSFIISVPFILQFTQCIGSIISIDRQTITQDTLNELILYTKYSSAAYVFTDHCPNPLNSTLITEINNHHTDTQGFIARNDARKEIIVAFAGTQSIRDALTDLDFARVPLTTQGFPTHLASRVLVHHGFLTAFNSVSTEILASVRLQLEQYPSYSIVSTGFSLGASLASICSISLKSNFPDVSLRLFTFGQPRTGNNKYAELVEKLVGVENIYRAIHTIDGVPGILPTFLGYKHHGIEYWNFIDPGTTENVVMCTVDEDPACSASVPSTGINVPHFFYFGNVMGADKSLCGI